MNKGTIAAIATAPGRGGVGVIRISGSNLLPFAFALTGKSPKPRYATLADFLAADGSTIDTGLLLYFPNPHSFTGEDVLELQGHGGPVVLQLLLARCLDLGARLAEPGEFSRRAFLNGKMDLAQAEAVADLIDAATASAARSAVRSLQGEFSRAIGELNEELINLRMLVEATLDFPEEDIDFLKAADAFGRLERLQLKLAEIFDRAGQGKLLQTGPGRQNSPPGSYEIIDLDLSRYDSIAKRFAVQTKDDISFLKSGIKTRNRHFNELIAEVEKVTLRSDMPIMLSGPTGAGKSRLARQIYELRRQRNMIKGRFVEVNCATLRGDMAMSVLFGHKKGAYTGATESREGLLKAADGGILFLDEIGELGLDEQAMLLRAIEEKVYLPVGSDKEVRSDFQLITGTNRNLRHECQAGRFRQDLLARIKFWEFTIPGLRERPEDIDPNIDYELQQHSKKLGKPVSFSSEARQEFVRFAVSNEAIWTANFRDLNNSLARMITLSEGNRINRENVQTEMARLRKEWSTERQFAAHEGRLCQQLLTTEQLTETDLFDRLQLEKVLEICRRCDSMAEAGRQLFSNSSQKKRSTNDSDRLRKYLQRFGISWKMIGTGE